MTVTEILYTRIDPARNLADPTSSDFAGSWSTLLKLAEQSEGFRKHVWCRGLEDPAHVRLHIVRDTLEQHTAFHQSEDGKKLDELLQGPAEPGIEVERHHAVLKNETAEHDALAAPVTSTALFLSTESVFTDLVWPLWMHNVRHEPGYRGLTSGKVIDRKSGQPAFIIYAGWDCLESHRAYWKDPGLDDKRGILEIGHAGRTEAYHVVFDRSE